jgi:hypothetical protein
MRFPEILITTRQAYGHTRIYPACRISHLLCEIKGSPCLIKRDLERLQEIGFTVRDVTPRLDEKASESA